MKKTSTALVAATLLAGTMGAGAAEPADINAYYGLVERVLENKCWSCHNEDKAKGKLRMDSFELMMKGGDGGPSVDHEDLANSELIYRITTDDEDDMMPPEDKEQLTAEEKAVIEWWVLRGAHENKKLGELEGDEKVKGAIDTVLKSVKPKSDADIAKVKAERAAKAKAAAEKAERAAKLAAKAADLGKEIGVPLLPVAQGEDKLQFTAVNVTDTFGDAELAKLAPVAGAMADVNLARTQVTDAGMAEIAKMSKLERLRLENTTVSDAGLAKLEGLSDLAYLNLYGTKVSDAGLGQLAGLKNLKKLFVWQTGVTRAGAEKLVEQMPGLVVNLGWDNEVPGPTPEEKAAEAAKRKAEMEAKKKEAEEKKKAEEAKKKAEEEAKKKAEAEKKKKEEAAKKAKAEAEAKKKAEAEAKKKAEAEAKKKAEAEAKAESEKKAAAATTEGAAATAE